MQQLTKANENCAVQLHTVRHMHTHTHTRTPTLAAQVAEAEVEADAVAAASICQLKVERCGQVRHQGQRQLWAERETGTHSHNLCQSIDLHKI